LALEPEPIQHASDSVTESMAELELEQTAPAPTPELALKTTMDLTSVDDSNLFEQGFPRKRRFLFFSSRG
jgi:hypothetical protein